MEERRDETTTSVLLPALLCAKPDTETKEVICEYRDSTAGYCRDHDQYDGTGALTLVRRDVEKNIMK